MPDDSFNNEFDDIFQTEPRLTRADVRQEVAKALADVAQYSAQTTAGVAHAIEEASAQYPDFKERLDQMRHVVAEEPVLRDAINQAEGNPALQSYLAPLYGIAYRLSQSPAQPGSEPAQSERPESPRPSGLSEEQIFMGTEESKRIDLSRANRQRLITDLEKRGVLDVEF